MIDSTAVRADVITVNGAEIYHEVRGSGESVVLIAGATGDAGHFTRFAELLATEFMVTTYDRRGNSRSPAPAGWTSTSVDEQADDLAALVEALDLAPAALYGTSAGAIIGLDAVLRHPRLLRGAILHEPPLISVVARPDEAMALIQPIVERGMERGGPRGAVEAFLGFVAGDSLQDLDAATVERMLGNAQVLLGLEFGVFEAWHPDEAALAAVTIPIQVMRGTELAAPFFGEAAAWTAKHLGTAVVTAPGRHTPNFDRPAELAEAILPFLHTLTTQRRSR